MNQTEMRAYAALMQEMDLTGLEIDEQRGVYRLERSGGKTNAGSSMSNLPETTEMSEAEKAVETEELKGEATLSPMVGVFYTAPTENAEPFVKVGDHVRKGDILCIIEAMKLMNEVSAEVEGEVVEVCAENGQFVEYGTPLFRIREGKKA